MNSLIKKIEEMNEKFSISPSDVPFSATEKKFRYDAMVEEIEEYKTSYTPEDELDALIDLVVFAIGTAVRQGWADIFEEAYNRVMEANCKKEVGPNQKRGSFALDLVKPEGWEAADLKDLVKKKEKINFTQWLFSESKNPKFIYDESDPVNLLKNKYATAIDWPININSLEELEKFIENRFKENIDNKIKAEIYVARLAWKDYEEKNNV